MIIALSRMKKVHEINIRDRYAVVDPGVVNLQLTKLVQAQGYHFAPPLTKDAMTGLLAEHHQYRLPEGVFPKRRQTSAA